MTLESFGNSRKARANGGSEIKGEGAIVKLMELATSNASLVREEPAQNNWNYTVDARLVIVVSAPIERLCSNEGIGIAFHFKPPALNPASEEPPSTLCSMTPILAKVLFQKKKKLELVVGRLIGSRRKKAQVFLSLLPLG